MMRKILLFTAMSLFFVYANAQDFSARKYLTPEQKLNNEYASGLFKNADGTILDIASDNSVKSYFNILDYLQGRVAGLQIYHQKDGTPLPFIRNQVANVYLDEMPIAARDLNMISSSDIAMIKVIKEPFVGAFGASSVIAVYTLNDDEDDWADDPDVW